MKTLLQWVIINITALSVVSCGRNTNSQNPEIFEDLIVGLWVDSTGCLDPSRGGNALLEYISENPSSLEYDFKKLADTTGIFITTSEDRKLRIYSWNTFMGGTSPCFAAIAQANMSGNVIVGGLDFYKEDDESGNVLCNDKSQDEYYGSCLTKLINQVKNSKGESIYLVEVYAKISSVWGFNEVFALTIKDGMLKKAEYFPSDAVKSIEYNIPDWYFRTDGMGWDWVPSFDKATETLYIPHVYEGKITDQYELYRNDGQQMKYMGVDGGFWLHESVRKFQMLCCIHQTSRRMLRVDRLEDGSYRYASWRKGAEMSSEPEIVVASGYCDKSTETYVFKNGDYKYVVNYGKDQLEIKHSNRTIQTETFHSAE